MLFQTRGNASQHTHTSIAITPRVFCCSQLVLMRAQFESQLAEVAGRAQLDQQALAERLARERSELTQSLSESHTQLHEAEARLERALRENRALHDELDKQKGSVTLYEEKYMRVRILVAYSHFFTLYFHSYAYSISVCVNTLR